MTVVPGSRVGFFEILELVGSGGMGEVYRAHDPRLGRDVAIKVIPASFAADADRVRRFEQEARAAAALSHPNILAVHDVGTHESAPYIVSELLRGMTLRERISGGVLPVRRAIDTGVQIARGLAAAHQRNIVHRDLKPENVFVTDDGLVKILDFGLAKLTETDPRSVEDDSTRRAETQPGQVMGTAGYMSPEQLRGLPVDARSDIFSFGAVMYELLAGARAFRGETSVDVATAILKESPPDLPAAERHIAPALVRIIDRCLEKTPAARFQSAGDLAFALEALSAPSGVTETFPATGAASRRPMPWLGGAVAGLAIGAAATYGAVSYFRPAPPIAEAIAFPLTFPDGFAFVGGGPSGSSPAPVAISPDGRQLAFLGSGPDSVRMIWVRSRSEVSPRMLPGTEGALSPFWSPDSRHVAFFVPGAAGKLKRVEVAGGLPQDICGARNALGGSWSKDGVIVFATNAPGTGIQRVPATGGTPEAVTTGAPGEGLHSRPVFLPDGRRFLFRVLSGNASRGWVYLASLDSKDRHRLVETESSNTAYSAGHLLYLRGATLMAHPFDAADGALRGDPYPVVQGIQTFGAIPVGVFSASPNGVLVYQPGTIAAGTELRWFTRSGIRENRVGDVGTIGDVRMSRDGSRVAYSRRSDGADGTSDIWIVETATALANRFTFDSGNEFGAVFSPDGRDVVFNSSKKGHLDLYRKAADGTGSEVELFADDSDKSPADWSPDGRFLLYVRTPTVAPSPPSPGAQAATRAPAAAAGRQQLWVLPLEGDRKPFPLMPDDETQTPGSFSPDGRFVVFTGSDGSRNQVFVTPFPSTGTKWQISSAGGVLPRWSHDSKEIFFMSPPGGNELMAARVDATGAAVRRLEVKALFPVTIAAVRSAYAPAPDGQRFVINTPAGTESKQAAPPVIVIDWPALRRETK